MSSSNSKRPKALPFRIILSNADKNEYSSFAWILRERSRMPTLTETTAHLLLLRAFGKLYENITKNIPSEIDKNKLWQVYVTNAVRRFILFISAYRDLRPIDLKQKLEVYEFEDGVRYFCPLEKLLPPLDILMVWHSFLLNPKSFLDECARNSVLDFAYFPFPLQRINEAISKDTFEYLPRDSDIQTFTEITSNFINKLDATHEMNAAQTMSLKYNVTLSEILNMKLTIYCPMCHSPLNRVPYTNIEGTGFADKNFTLTPEVRCPCLKQLDVYIINHDTLRSLQMYSDVALLDHDLILPNVYKYYSSELHLGMFDEGKEYGVSAACKHLIKSLDLWKGTSVNEFIKKLWSVPKFSRIIKNILRHYLQMNLVHNSIPANLNMYSDGILNIPTLVMITEDLVGCILRQQRFVEKMNKINLLESPMLGNALMESSVRYDRYFQLMTMNKKNQIVVPTLDIDMFWHTHMLSMFYYLEKCTSSKARMIIDHNDKIEESRLSLNFEKTAKLYNDKFKEPYSICFCWYCVATREKFKKKKVFGKKKDEVKLYSTSWLFNWENETGITHISTHNYIEWPGTRGSKNRESLFDAYHQKPNQQYPWKDDPHQRASYDGMFVISPIAPISQQNTELWGPGACISSGPEGNGGGCSGTACGSSACGNNGPGKGALCGSAVSACGTDGSGSLSGEAGAMNGNIPSCGSDGWVD